MFAGFTTHAKDLFDARPKNIPYYKGLIEYSDWRLYDLGSLKLEEHK